MFRKKLIISRNDCSYKIHKQRLKSNHLSNQQQLGYTNNQIDSYRNEKGRVSERESFFYIKKGEKTPENSKILRRKCAFKANFYEDKEGKQRKVKR